MKLYFKEGVKLKLVPIILALVGVANIAIMCFKIHNTPKQAPREVVAIQPQPHVYLEIKQGHTVRDLTQHPVVPEKTAEERRRNNDVIFGTFITWVFIAVIVVLLLGMIIAFGKLLFD